MLSTLCVVRRPGVFAYASLTGPVPSEVAALATVAEPEGTTVVALADDLRRAGVEVLFECAWLSLEVHSSLEAVGLTAALSARLAAAGIPANVLAGAFHDHVLVPVDDAERAIAALLRV
jgi:uncharacterized protein